MRILLFGDLHCDANAAQNIVEMSWAADVVVGTGDFATNRKGLQEIIDALAAIIVPTLLVPGNSESLQELVSACKGWPAAIVLHGSGAEIHGVKFWGVGGGIPITTFPLSFDFSEDEGRRLFAKCPHEAILISHSPPKGILDHLPDGRSVGSVAVLEAVERCQPILVACGHIHSCAGNPEPEMVGNTQVINAGPKGIFWEVPSDYTKIV